MARAKPSAAVGVDPSEGQIEYARKRPGTQGAQFRVAGAQQLPFDSGSFDVAVMALVISFVPDPVQAVRELARVVKPGGCVATYMWDVPAGGLPLEPIRKALAAIGVAPASPPGFQAARESAMREAWTKAGLQSVETTVIWIRIEFANFDDFWESNTLPIGPDGAAVNALSPEQKGRFRTQLLQQLKSGPDGSIGYEAFANAVKGRVPG